MRRYTRFQKSAAIAETYNPYSVDDGYEDEEKEEVATAEWNWGKKTVMVPNPWGRGVKKELRFRRHKIRQALRFLAREGTDQVARQSCYVASRSVEE